MLKRTYGRLLLTLLVATGLAGKVNDTSLSKSERKFLLTQYKETRAALLSKTKDLSTAQLKFRTAPDKWSVEECIYHITLAETGLWELLEASLKNPANPEARKQIKVTDADLLKGVQDRGTSYQAPETFLPGKAPWKNAQEALAAFKEIRNRHIKYARTTTEDLRNKIVQLPYGQVDAYQMMLFIAGHSNRHLQQITQIMESPQFPSAK